MSAGRIVIAGTQSGVGKTSLALALVRALTRRGLRVQCFKVGPDFLDPSYLALASGRPCYNLDGWMCGREYVERLFARASSGADISVIEGVMGLFDGADPTTAEGSTAEIARWLDAPVLLVVNAHGMARSLAAMVKGFCLLEPDIRITGVLANQAGSARHAQWLAAALTAASLPPLWGAIPRGSLPELPSRHLGLVTADSATLTPSVLDQLADGLEKHVSVEDLAKEIMGREQHHGNYGKHGNYEFPMIGNSLISSVNPSGQSKARLGIAYDAAFHFYYPDTLEALEAQGVQLARFSPLTEARLPDGVTGLYFGGGYPEMHAAALAANAPMLSAVRRFAAQGGAIYAECGGLMYLASGIQATDGSRHEMLGLLPAWTRMLERRKALGYVEVALRRDALWGKTGDTVRGHEFHYSELVNDPGEGGSWEKTYSLKDRRAVVARAEGFQRGRILASYVHAHFAARPAALRHLATQWEGAA